MRKLVGGRHDGGRAFSATAAGRYRRCRTDARSSAPGVILAWRALWWIAALTVLSLFATGAKAVDGPVSGNVRILVLADDTDRDTIERGHPLSGRVIAGVQDAFARNRFQVYDETATSVDFGAARSQRSDEDLLTIAETVVPPIGVVVVIRILATAEPLGTGDMIVPDIRIEGRMLNVRSRRVLGSLEVRDNSNRPLSRGCRQRSCIAAEVGDRAADLGYALGDTMAVKLRDVLATPPSADPDGLGDRCTGMADTFVIRFSRFDTAETDRLESLLVRGGCYVHHSTIRSMPGLIEFVYDTTAGDARVARNLRGMLGELVLTGTVSQTGNLFEVVRTGRGSPQPEAPPSAGEASASGG